jgi:hypothetical protein
LHIFIQYNPVTLCRVLRIVLYALIGLVTVVVLLK